MRKRVLWIFSVILVIILVPLFIDWAIIGNSFPSHISNSDWVGFLGGYIGAIIGAIVSMAGIILTIWFTNQQNRQDRELEIKPYCLVELKPIIEIDNDEFEGKFYFEYKPSDREIGIKRELSCVTYCLEIQNVGVGPAVNCQIQQCTECIYGSAIKVEHGLSVINEVNCIAQSGGTKFEVQVVYEAMPNPNHEDWNNVDEEIREEPLILYPRCELPYMLNYSDMLGTKYQQEFSLEIGFVAYYSHTGVLTKEPTCKVKLGKVSVPIRMKEGT